MAVVVDEISLVVVRSVVAVVVVYSAAASFAVVVDLRHSRRNCESCKLEDCCSHCYNCSPLGLLASERGLYRL